ncbi:MAG: hypothetical protein JXN63_01395 [Candidatus Delongbacteria bacterium]|nr:hypothetical protein [Candidatus Delongbacteria bacterium]
MKLFEKLRREYPEFIYESFSYEFDKRSLKIRFRFVQSEDIIFEPETIFENCPDDFIPDEGLDAAVFSLGMIELVSYYKACCSPRIVIKAGSLNSEQISFWKKIYFNGLGEFLYKNGIETDSENLFMIVSEGSKIYPRSEQPMTDSSLIPVGGGKDSVVTLELLKDTDAIPFILNAREASVQSVKNAGYSEYFHASRKIDPLLLRLNSQGFLNGHTPFSALLSFNSSIAALINRTKNIVLSNENSANEGNVRFSGIEVNHQYSKSFAAEQELHDYISKYVHPSLNYFSFLRPLHELKIAELFSRFKGHYFSFRSCNAGSKTNIWCKKCPKCLFTYIILSPFIAKDDLVKIFGADLLNDISLEKIFLELCGFEGIKPFECVGTAEEVRAALGKTVTYCKEENIPYLLALYSKKTAGTNGRDTYSFDKLLKSFSDENLLDRKFKGILLEAL